MVGAFRIGTNKRINLFGGLYVCPRLNFFVSVGVKSGLMDDLAGKANTIPKAFNVVWVLLIVEVNTR